MLKIGDNLYHPCSMDIMEHKVTSIHIHETFTEYVIKATHPIGACGYVESLIRENKKGVFIFIELVVDTKWSSGLEDFVEGFYYQDKNEAKIEYYNIQLNLALSNKNRYEHLLEEATNRYNQVSNLIKVCKEELTTKTEK